MQVSLSNVYSNKKQQSFQSRSPEIRFAEDVMRRVNREFLCISPSKLSDRFLELSASRDVSSKYGRYIRSLGLRNTHLRNFRSIWSTNPFGYLCDVMKDVQYHRIGNCGELATIGKAALLSNGLPALKATLCVYKGDMRYGVLDHSMDIVNLEGFPIWSRPLFMGKRSYVVDLWRGIVDYSSNAFKMYESEYGRALQPDADGAPKTLGISLEDNFPMDKRAVNFVQSQYPALVIK